MFYCDGRVDGRVDGLTGGRVDGEQKGPLFFFILRYIKHYIHIYLYTKEKLSGQTSCGFIFWSSWRVALTIFKITLLGRHFSKMGLKVDFLEKNNKHFPLKYTHVKFKGNSLIIFERGLINLERIFHV